MLVRLTTERGTSVSINPAHIVLSEPATDKNGAPLVGLTNLLLSLLPPLVPGAHHVAVVVRGSHDEVDAALGTAPSRIVR